jgi:hypothetical protein
VTPFYSAGGHFEMGRVWFTTREISGVGKSKNQFHEVKIQHDLN